jgi:ribosomal-protein-serine acetyltransferase
MVRVDDSTAVGQAGLHRLDRQVGRGELTYWVAASSRGDGIATRAVRCISRFAFSALGLQRLELLTMVDNAASQRVAEKAGFVREGIRRSALPIKGARPDLVVFSLLPSDLEASSA